MTSRLAVTADYLGIHTSHVKVEIFLFPDYHRRHRRWVKWKNECYRGKLDQKLSLHAKEHHCISKTLAVSPPPPYIKLVPV